MDVTVTTSGPLFDGQAQGVMDAIVDESAHVVAAFALERVHYRLDRSIRHPTPYYETQITQQRAGLGEEIVHDRGIVYGPWLEGVGRRNATTRFKGYAAFRTATGQVQEKAVELVEGVITRHITQLGG